MKKKELTINQLALGNLKQRRKQYTILIIGIILAMIFSSAIPFYLFGSYETALQLERNRIGNQDGVIYLAENDEKLFKKALDDGVINAYGVAHIIGYGYADEENKAGGVNISWLDDEAKALSNQSFIEGTYPTNGNEIAFEQSTLDKLGIDAEIGDEITLQVMIQNNTEYFGTVTKTYTLVGIASDKKSNMGAEEWGYFLPDAFVAQGTQTEVGGRELVSAYIDTDNGIRSFNTLHDYLFSNYDNVRIAWVNAEWNTDTDAFLYNGDINIVLVIFVLIIASCIGIVNSFNTNLKERKKQIGMLRAVGATKRQMIKIFVSEARIISLICTPISMAISYFLAWGLIKRVKGVAFTTKSFSVIVISAVICMIVTMLAAMFPLVIASRITPMQCIRDINITRKMTVKKIISKKRFEVSSHLAKRNAQFYKGGKIAVSIMLTLTILLSCMGFSLMNYERNNYVIEDYDYEMRGMGIYDDGHSFANYDMRGIREADKREIDSFPYFAEITSKRAVRAILEVDRIDDYFLCLPAYRDVFYDYGEHGEVTYENYMAQTIDLNNERYLENKNRYSSDGDILPVGIYSYDDHMLNALENSLIDGSIDIERLDSGEEIILVAPQTAKFALEIMGDNLGFSPNTVYDDEEPEDGYRIVCEGKNLYSVGDKIKLSVIEYNSEIDMNESPDIFDRVDKEVTIAAIVSPRALGNEYELFDDFAVLTTHAGMNAFSSNARYVSLHMNMSEDIEVDGDTEDIIMSFLGSFSERNSMYIESNYANIQSREQSMRGRLFSSICIVILGFVICGSIINNSLTASIRERKREIGTLRAVGADIGVLIKSYIIQLFSMLGIGYIAGFAGFIVAYLIAFIKSRSDHAIYSVDTFSYVFSPWETLAFCAILFAICSINLWSKVKKEMKNSIVENIKEL